MSTENLEQLRVVQKKLSKKIVVEDRFRRPITNIAGIDIAFKGDIAITAYVAMSFPSLNLVSEKTSMSTLGFPYIPSFLCFREGPPIVDIITSLDIKPEVFLINAQGIAHPLFIGCASHIGVLTQCPTIGVTQSNLCGEYEYEPKEVGRYVSMSYNERTVGWVFKSKRGCKPIFISPGHLIGLDSSLEIVKRCMREYKLPLPLYYAHKLASETKRMLNNSHA